MRVRQEEVKDFIQKNPVSRVEGKIGSKVMFYFLLYFIEVPMETIATLNRDHTILLWRECHANKKWTIPCSCFIKGTVKSEKEHGPYPG